MREVHAGECQHEYVEWFWCDECEAEEPHEFAVCLDCGQDPQ